ncbi:hypothetical protein KCU85_g332, partial [Aureobasidium melanogenum]
MFIYLFLSDLLLQARFGGRYIPNLKDRRPRDRESASLLVNPSISSKCRTRTVPRFVDERGPRSSKESSKHTTNLSLHPTTFA